jgi:hypothetical protein
LRAFADERLSSSRQERGAYAYADFRYGDVAAFRAIGFGYPDTTLLVLTCFPHHVNYLPPDANFPPKE